MTMREGHMYKFDQETTGGLYRSKFTSNGSYAQVYGETGGGSNDTWYVARFSNEHGQTDDSFVWDRVIDNLPNGNYRIEVAAATKYYNAATMNGFTFKINGIEQKDKIVQIPNDFNGDDISCAAGSLYFRANFKSSVITQDIKVTNGKINLHIEKGHLGVASSLYMANWEIIYLGKDKTEIEMTFPMYYNTLMLPFDVAELPENLHAFIPQEEHVSTLQTDKPIYEADGEIYSYHLVTLNEPITDGIKANTPYIIVNDNGYILEGDATAVNASAPKAKAPRKANTVDSRTYKFYGYPNEDEATEGILTGVHEDTTLDSEHYALDQSSTFQAFFMNDETTDIEAHRAYIDIYNLAEDTAVEHPIIVFNAQPNPLTGVETVAAEADADAPVVYYNLQGVRVENPQQGIFIRRQGTKIEKVAL